MLDTAIGSGSGPLLSFAAAYAAMLVIPGPSFAIVSHVSLSASRQEATLVAAGVASGASLLIAFILAGASFFPATQPLIEIARLCCILLLFVVGLRALRRSTVAPEAPQRLREKAGPYALYATGFLTAMTNPISFGFFSSAVLAIGERADRSLDPLLPASVFLMAFGWFAFIALLLSAPASRSAFRKWARHLDALTGAVLVGIAIGTLISFR